MKFLNCTNLICFYNTKGHCRLGNEIDELVDDFRAGDITGECPHYEEIKVASEEFES